MDPERYRHSTSGRLVRAGTSDAAYWAFVPDTLPPAWQPDLGLVRLLSAADRALGELAGLGRAMPNPHLLVGPFIRREAVASSRIEGTQAGIGELYAFEAGHGPRGNAAADVQEVANYVKAMEYGLARLKDLPVSLRLLKDVHAVLMQGVRGGRATPGEFRTTQNWIGRPGSLLADADYVPPPPGEMANALGELEKYLHAENGYPPLVRLAFIHQQFEAIHPFLDGNGRLGRLMITFLMVSWDLLPLPLLYMSSWFETNRDTYYDLLRAVSERGVWDDWVTFFLRGVSEQARDAVARAKKLQDLQHRWRGQLQDANVPVWLLGAVDGLFKSPTTSSPSLQTQYRISAPTALRGLQVLVRMGILEERTGRRYGRVYVASDITNISD